ncbi:MAG: hypothetical protein KAJ40_06965 [Alphaproteobacteria bacterium]|nr:hypothetical protein [Alphaproteobacteria bacterium]
MSQSNQQLALLKNRLQIPLIARDLLSDDKMPNDEETYAMHDMLCDFSTEEALLCAAFVMKEIAALGNVSPSDMAFFHMECERLIERYSARDDLAQDNPELWSNTQIDMLDEIAEDLEGFLDLLSLCKLSYEITAPAVTHIIEILDAQLQSQLVIIDEVISMHEAAAKEKLEERVSINASPVHSIDANRYQFSVYGDNILQFPTNAAAHN